jgi:hypothetical protein
MTSETDLTKKPQECRLCSGRICVVMEKGRLINDNGDKRPIDTSKIVMNEVKIEDCEIRNNS